MAPEGKTGPGRQEGWGTVIAVDTGGTFTDVILLKEGTLFTLKVPSTPHDPSEAVLDGIRIITAPSGSGKPGPFDLLHGSTVATNALLERRGARVVLVTNEGFEDVLEIGRQNRPQLYALHGYRAPPLVGREHRLGVAGRLDHQGREVEPLDEGQLEGLVEEIRQRGEPDALAVCLLHSYADSSHEEAVAQALEPLGLPLSISSRLLPEFREYERTSTTVVNAYVAPVMSRYLERVNREGGAARLRIMGSGGGALPVSRAIAEPVQTVLSGPAGGVVGALDWARRSGFDGVLTFDMGGTSTDVSLCPGRPLQTREFEIDGSPVAIPVIDIHTVGAGGGSLARVDPGGALRVGPESAGAAPGPVAYGKGGTIPTVTDAHVWLGRLPSEGFLGGAAELDREAVGPAMAPLAEAMGASPERVALGIIEVANAAMERALRVISVERGHDPRDFVLVAFGGAGGLHVAELAERLGTRGALIPPNPGLLSAYGMLVAPVVREASRTVLLGHDVPGATDTIGEVLSELSSSAISQMASEGFPTAGLEVESWVDARYQGQSFELRVPAEGWVEEFHRAHRSRYGYARHDASVTAVTLRTLVRAPGAQVEIHRLPDADGPPDAHTTTVATTDGPVEATTAWRRDLRAGHTLEGPALVLEYSSTTWVPEGWTLEVDPWGSLLLKAAS
jgi:N-methylhydantoinase A